MQYAVTAHLRDLPPLRFDVEALDHKDAEEAAKERLSLRARGQLERIECQFLASSTKSI